MLAELVDGEARDRGAGELSALRRPRAWRSTPIIRAFMATCAPTRDFKAGYDGFERLNGALKQLITDWQTIDVGGERVPNDHGDKDYDHKIIDRLGDLHERAEGVLDAARGRACRACASIATSSRALEKAEDGAIAWVSDARIESYHTLWFELHEDLLRLMGREREE